MGSSSHILEASSCIQSLFTSFAVVNVIKNFTPFCINKFQSTFCHSYRGKFPPAFLFPVLSPTCWFLFLYMLQLAVQHKAPVSWRGGRKTKWKAPPESGRAVHANNVVSMVALSALPDYPGSQAAGVFSAAAEIPAGDPVWYNSLSQVPTRPGWLKLLCFIGAKSWYLGGAT